MPIAEKPAALVTGVRGFTGRYIFRALGEAGYDVFGLVHPGQEFGEQIEECNILDRTSLAKTVEKINPAVVVHLAAISFVAHSDADQIYRTNICGTRNLLEALEASASKVKAVLLPSSANIYGNSSNQPISETLAAAPENDYAVSKLAMEHMARLWFDRLPIIIVRPFNYTGVGQSGRFVVPKIVDHFKRGAREIELGNIDVFRDISDVRMVVDAYLRLLEAAPAGQTFNVCSGRLIALRDIIQSLESLAGYRIGVKVNPQFVRQHEVKVLEGLNEKLVRIIGPLHDISLEETLRWMFTTDE